jgi:DNA-directed RNA polymerase subunit RPC12/RpoP
MHLITESVLTCPYCGAAHLEQMEADSCRMFYKCSRCGEMIRPLPGDCCVYCSYGTVPCPPIQIERANAKDENR